MPRTVRLGGHLGPGDMALGRPQWGQFSSVALFRFVLEPERCQMCLWLWEQVTEDPPGPLVSLTGPTPRQDTQSDRGQARCPTAAPGSSLLWGHRGVRPSPGGSPALTPPLTAAGEAAARAPRCLDRHPDNCSVMGTQDSTVGRGPFSQASPSPTRSRRLPCRWDEGCPSRRK